MRNVAGIVILIACAGTALCQELPPVANGGGISLRDLKGSEKLVTIVLKERGAVDQNLRVLDIGPDYVSVASLSGERTSYLLSSIAEVRLQDGKVESRKVVLDEGRSMKADDQRIVDRAFDRAREIYEAASKDQNIKMRAAVLLALSGKKEARDYLRSLAASNDLETKLDALLRLYLAGESDLGGPLISVGLQSGNRKIKAKAAKLAGLAQEQSVVPLLAKMQQDRVADICVPAARALARLKYREGIPTLMKMLLELSEEKGEAAIFALTRLDGPEVIEQAKSKLKTTTGQMQYRLVNLLYNLGDPLGKQLLIQQMDIPTLRPQAALLLARDGNWDAAQFLISRLKQRFDEKEDVMIFRAKAAAALIQGTDPTSVSYLQDLLRSDNAIVKKAVCGLIGELGKRKLVSILQPAVENSNADIALQACYAAIAIARPEFRERFVEFQK